jgi:hypothetical protein
MAGAYAETDWEVVNYHVYHLDPQVLDRQTKTALLLRGPKLDNLEAGKYFVCIGGAQTFGRFCDKPYPTLLQEKLGLPALNLGRGGAGPSFFSQENDKLLAYINRARFAIVQVMAGRSEGNTLFHSNGLGTFQRRSDGTWIGCDEAFKELLAEKDKAYVSRIVSETRENWLKNFIELLEAIKVPKILFWLSARKPYYQEQYRDIQSLFGEFPQLVNSDMVDRLRKHSNNYVECISRKGMGRPLINRFTGEKTTIADPWGGTWTKNWYYPSPQMHICAAKALVKICKKYLAKAGNDAQSKPIRTFMSKFLRKRA